MNSPLWPMVALALGVGGLLLLFSLSGVGHYKSYQLNTINHVPLERR